jgi:hypothetical protein
MTVGGWGRSQDCSRRCVESPRPREKRAPVSTAQCRTLVPVSIVLCWVVRWVRGAWVGAACAVRQRAAPSLAGALQRRERDTERWLQALAFSLPTSTSSARGVVQFWLTRRPTPAAIYGHRHPGGVSGLALSSRLFSHRSPPLQCGSSLPNPIILGVRAQQRRSGSTFTTYTIPKDTRPRFTS